MKFQLKNRAHQHHQPLKAAEPVTSKLMRIEYALVALLVLMACHPLGAHAGAAMPDRVFVGTVYKMFHPLWRTDQEFYTQVSRDIANMKKANMEVVMPFPLGQWDNRGKIMKWERSDYLVRRIEEAGLKMMPIIWKSNSRNWMPLWRYLEIPDADREMPGKRPKESIYGMKYQHPQMMAAVEAYIGKLTTRYKDSPSMFGYNLWNEPHYVSMDEITIPKFQNWLKVKYSTLETLNVVWGRDYSDWKEVDPARKGNWTSSMPDIDWEIFRQHNVADLSQWITQTMRKYDPDHFININTCSSMPTYFRGDHYSIDEWRISPHTDVFGISFYPDEWERWTSHFKEEHPLWRKSLTYNAIRCASKDKPYMLSELQTNVQSGLRIEKSMTYDDMHLLSWLALANNCKGIVYWCWRPFLRGKQSFGRGLCQTDGELGPRGIAAKDIGAFLKQHGELLYRSQVLPADAAILWDHIGYFKSTEVEHRARMFFTDSYEGTYKALWEENISVDIVRTDLPLTLQALQKYKIIYLPFQIVVAPAVADLLKAYVHSGGWIVADARVATIDHQDFGYAVNPGAGLHQLFGARRLDGSAHMEPIPVQFNPGKRFEGAFAQDALLKGRFYKEKLKVAAGAEVLATFSEDNTPALVANTYGQGKTFLAAFPLGGSYRHNEDGHIARLMVSMAGMAGVKPAAAFKGEGPDHACMIKVHQSGARIIVYAINTSAEQLRGTISLPAPTQDLSSARDMMAETRVRLTSDHGRYTFPISLAPYRTRLFQLQ